MTRWNRIDVSTGVVHERRGAPSHASLLVMQAGQNGAAIFHRLPKYWTRAGPAFRRRRSGIRAVGTRARWSTRSQSEDRRQGGVLHKRHAQRPARWTLFPGGRCMGGLVAFEIAHQLLAQGQAVALLALFDTPAPRQYSDDAANAVTENRVGSASTDHRRNTRREIVRQAIRRMTTWLRKRAFECYVGLESFSAPHDSSRPCPESSTVRRRDTICLMRKFWPDYLFRGARHL
mgnify:CR=1 FL=1